MNFNVIYEVTMIREARVEELELAETHHWSAMWLKYHVKFT